MSHDGGRGSQLQTSNSKLQISNSKLQIPKVLESGTRDARSSSIQPYDLRERLLNFACVIVRLVQYLHTRGPIAVALSSQLLRCGTSAGANYEEADGGSSDGDTLAKRQIALRELKETRFRLRTLRLTGYLTEAHDPVIQETFELVKIVAKLVRNAKSK